MTQNLVVLSGYPRSGKSRTAEVLKRIGFSMLSSDKIRENLFGMTWLESYRPPGHPEQREYGIREATIDDTIGIGKIILLNDG